MENTVDAVGSGGSPVPLLRKRARSDASMPLTGLYAPERECDWCDKRRQQDADRLRRHRDAKRKSKETTDAV
jgi:hypothetical protein